MAKVPGVVAARETLASVDATYIAQQITRMEAAVLNDPALAIGTAKELIESCCKTILRERSVEIPKDADIPRLVKLTSQALQLTPTDIPDATKAAEVIKRLLANLATVGQGIAELRNQYGTGHGKVSGTKGVAVSSCQAGRGHRIDPRRISDGEASRTRNSRSLGGSTIMKDKEAHRVGRGQEY